ncbi:HupE/UreJ family protein [Fuscovulum ytuae]|uniref:HupE/UreJ family protein n=1 Tax=Fuscovulum ytuae TaxID=3042299 RepID=A0ABY8QC48_9RHOB|nr:HupE/UreJ family protein [Fuscovulum sp. YMD61]WGV18433.1 HupE/UreJ family protein [Fuscovulum sp. YMD61]
MRKLALSTVATLLAGPALAHTGHGAADGFLHGLGHPVFGMDHLLAMVTVGLWSGFVLPQRFWAGAMAFMGAMVLGAALSWYGFALLGVETLITSSVVVFGLLTLLTRRGQGAGMTTASLAAIAAFALAHGHAHATEATGQALAYLAGFLSSTAALHLAGIALARSVAEGRFASLVQRVLGGGVAMGGLLLAFG